MPIIQVKPVIPGFVLTNYNQSFRKSPSFEYTSKKTKNNQSGNDFHSILRKSVKEK